MLTVIELGTERTVFFNSVTNRRQVIRHNPPRDWKEVLQDYSTMLLQRELCADIPNLAEMVQDRYAAQPYHLGHEVWNSIREFLLGDDDAFKKARQKLVDDYVTCTIPKAQASGMNAQELLDYAFNDDTPITVTTGEPMDVTKPYGPEYQDDFWNGAEPVVLDGHPFFGHNFLSMGNGDGGGDYTRPGTNPDFSFGPPEPVESGITIHNYLSEGAKNLKGGPGPYIAPLTNPAFGTGVNPEYHNAFWQDAGQRAYFDAMNAAYGVPAEPKKSKLLDAAEARNVLDNPLLRLPGTSSDRVGGIRLRRGDVAEGVGQPSLGQFRDFRDAPRSLPQWNAHTIMGVLRHPKALGNELLDEATLKEIAKEATRYRRAQGVLGGEAGPESAELYIRIFRALQLDASRLAELTADDLERLYLAYLSVHAA